jgi:type I site-specific restriction-modification system R (restriction) subunit
LPIATFELKNRLTKQTVEDAVQQYKRDRDSRELLFQFKRCLVHFAVDDQEVRFCTQLKDKSSWFLPFNKGWNDGAGNPPNPDGLKTDYLWKEVLTKTGLTDILENYAQVVEEEDDKGKKKQNQIFPRYHQLRVVHRLLADTGKNGTGTQRKLLRLHRDPKEQDLGDLWRARASGRQGEASPFRQLYDEASDRGGVHPRCAGRIHARQQLLSADEES